MASFQSDFRSLKQHLRTRGGSSHHGNWPRHLQNGNPEHPEGFFVWDHVDPCSTPTIASPASPASRRSPKHCAPAVWMLGWNMDRWFVKMISRTPKNTFGFSKVAGHSPWISARIVMGVHLYQCISVYIYCIYNLACLNEWNCNDYQLSPNYPYGEPSPIDSPWSSQFSRALAALFTNRCLEPGVSSGQGTCRVSGNMWKWNPPRMSLW